MKIPRILFILLFVMVALGFVLGYFNRQAQDGNPAMGYLQFNRASSKQAEVILDYWRAPRAPHRESAVKAIVTTDLVVIVVYVFFFSRWLLFRRAIETSKPSPGARKWLVGWLGVGVAYICAGGLIDLIQDLIVYADVASGRPPSSLSMITLVKWIVLALGVLPLLVSFVPASQYGKWRRDLTLVSVNTTIYLGGLMKMIWTFFASLVFIFLTIYSFWIRSQGKDILVAFTEKKRWGFDSGRVYFFLVIAFWVYLTWYSSRVIAYIKKKRSNFPGPFLDNYPRLAGNACFLVLELAVLQSPIRESPMKLSTAWIGLGIGLIVLFFIDRLAGWLLKDSKKISNYFWLVFLAFLGLVFAAADADRTRAPFYGISFGSWSCFISFLSSIAIFITKWWSTSKKSRSRVQHPSNPAPSGSGSSISFASPGPKRTISNGSIG